MSNHDNHAKRVADKVPTEVVCPANTSNAPDAKAQGCNPATIQPSDPVVQSCDGATYWHLQDKNNPKRNVWVSGIRGLCDTPDRALAVAQDCKECLDGEWNIIQFNTLEELNYERTRQCLLH